ncbi:MAG: peptidoglycan editing factor PgeF [Elusimicrobiota bacterium]|nr:peptidoglycan editing factor PgeF [Elusimicrobiota bacterium]
MKDPILRKNFLKEFGISPQKLVLANQVHSNIVKKVSNADCAKIIDHCDGLITGDKNVYLGIFTADCMPIIMVSKNGGVKAAVHAGWQGLKAQIIEQCIKIFNDDFGIKSDEIDAYIGPHIQKCCYEVSKDFEQIFNVKLENNKLNLAQIAKEKMQNANIKNIVISPYCTKCADLFFSYRKDKTDARIITVV